MIKTKLVILATIPFLFFIFGNVKAIELYNKENRVVTLNGSMNTSHLFSEDVDNDGDFTFFNLGLKGETKITDNLIGYGVWQYHFKNKVYETIRNNNPNNTNLAYVGVKYGNFGSLDYGRNVGLIYKTMFVTESLQSLNTIAKRSEGFLSGRSGGVATYHNKNFFGLIEGFNFDLQYQGKNHFNYRYSAWDANGEGYAAFVSYKHSNITLSSSFAIIDRINIQNKMKYGYGKQAQLWATSIKYDSNPIYFAASYGENLHATPITYGFANKTKNLELLLQGKILDSSVRPILFYSHSKAYNVEQDKNKSIDFYLHKYIGVGTTYLFNKDINIYAEYKFNLLKKHNVKRIKVSKDNIAAFGFNYSF